MLPRGLRVFEGTIFRNSLLAGKPERDSGTLIGFRFSVDSQPLAAMQSRAVPKNHFSRPEDAFCCQAELGKRLRLAPLFSAL
jgi:hypothetical protein